MVNKLQRNDAGSAAAAASQHEAISPESSDENDALMMPILSGALIVAAVSARTHKAATSDASNDDVNGEF